MLIWSATDDEPHCGVTAKRCGNNSIGSKINITKKITRMTETKSKSKGLFSIATLMLGNNKIRIKLQHTIAVDKNYRIHYNRQTSI